MRQFTPKELLAIEEFLNESEEVLKNNDFIKIYQEFQRNLLKIYKKLPKKSEATNG